MIHVDESTLLAYLDGQASARREEVAAHVATCTRCAVELQSLRDMTADLRGALSLMDVAAPIGAARARIDAARRAVRRGGWSPAVRLGPFRMGVLQAAALALILAGVAGAAIPGSPLRLWLESTFSEEEAAIPEIVVPAPPVAEPVAPVPVQPTPTPTEYGVDPVDGRVLVALREPPAGIRLIVRLADTGRTTVEATASPTGFSGGVALSAIGGDQIIVTLPRTITSARIEVDGELIVHREGTEFILLPPNHEPSGDEIVIPLVR
jgi:anti-sigma factor RsiW